MFQTTLPTPRTFAPLGLYTTGTTPRHVALSASGGGGGSYNRGRRGRRYHSRVGRFPYGQSSVGTPTRNLTLTRRRRYTIAKRGHIQIGISINGPITLSTRGISTMFLTSVSITGNLSSPHKQRECFRGNIIIIRLSVVRRVIKPMTSNHPLNRLLFQMGRLVDAITRRGFDLRVPFHAKSSRFYTRLLRRKDNFRQTLGVSTSHRGASVGVTSTRHLRRFHINTITSLNINRGTRGNISTILIFIRHRSLVTRLIRLLYSITTGSARPSRWGEFRNVCLSLSCNSTLLQRPYHTTFTTKRHYVGRDRSTSTPGRRRRGWGPL